SGEKNDPIGTTNPRPWATSAPTRLNQYASYRPVVCGATARTWARRIPAAPTAMRASPASKRLSLPNANPERRQHRLQHVRHLSLELHVGVAVVRRASLRDKRDPATCRQRHAG